MKIILNDTPVECIPDNSLTSSSDFRAEIPSVEWRLDKIDGVIEKPSFDRIDMSYELNRLHYMVGQKHNFDI